MLTEVATANSNMYKPGPHWSMPYANHFQIWYEIIKLDKYTRVSQITALSSDLGVI